MLPFPPPHLEGLSSVGLYSPSSRVPSSYKVLAMTNRNLSPENNSDIRGWRAEMTKSLLLFVFNTYPSLQGKSECLHQGWGPSWKIHSHNAAETLEGKSCRSSLPVAQGRPYPAGQTGTSGDWMQYNTQSNAVCIHWPLVCSHRSAGSIRITHARRKGETTCGQWTESTEKNQRSSGNK